MEDRQIREVYVSCHLVLSVIIAFYFFCLFVLENLLLESCEEFELYFVSFWSFGTLS